MKILCILLILFSFAFVACSDDSHEAEITIEEEGEPIRTIRIIVEGKKDVIIEDPYIEEIETWSKEYQAKRRQYIKEHKDMTPEERKAFGELRDRSGERVRELQKLRKSYLREQMKKHNGVRFTVESKDIDEAVEETSNYLDSFQNP